MVVDLETCKVTQVIPENAERKFSCYSQSFMERPGVILSEVQGLVGNRKLIRYSLAGDELTIVGEFGK